VQIQHLICKTIVLLTVQLLIMHGCVLFRALTNLVTLFPLLISWFI